MAEAGAGRCWMKTTEPSGATCRKSVATLLCPAAQHLARTQFVDHSGGTRPKQSQQEISMRPAAHTYVIAISSCNHTTSFPGIHPFILRVCRQDPLLFGQHDKQPQTQGTSC